MLRVKIGIVTIFALLFSASAFGQTISNVTGTVSQGSAITVYGSGFGSKATARPIRYDDFESGTVGTRLLDEASGGWFTDHNLAGYDPSYSNTFSRIVGGKSAWQRYENGNYNSTIALTNSGINGKIYISGWFYGNENFNYGSRNFKWLQLTNTSYWLSSYQFRFDAYPIDSRNTTIFWNGNQSVARSIIGSNFGTTAGTVWAGNASTLAASTLRQQQTVISWSNSLISVWPSPDAIPAHAAVSTSRIFPIFGQIYLFVITAANDTISIGSYLASDYTYTPNAHSYVDPTTGGWPAITDCTYENSSGTSCQCYVFDTSIALGYELINTNGSWHRFEVWFDQGTLGNRDGSYVISIDGKPWFHNDGSFMPVAESTIHQMWLSFYFATDTGIPQPSMNRYWDELYVDSTRTRVEIGNASTFAACTHREIQIPTAWSNTSITATVNLGSFTSTAGLYAFVVAADGTASAGFLLGSSDPGPPGQPSQPIRREITVVTPELAYFEGSAACVSTTHELTTKATRTTNSSVFTQWSSDDGATWDPAYTDIDDANWSAFGTGQYTISFDTGIDCSLEGTLQWRMRVKDTGTYVSDWYPIQYTSYTAPPAIADINVLWVHRSNGYATITTPSSSNAGGSLYSKLLPGVHLNHWYISSTNYSSAPYGAWRDSTTVAGTHIPLWVAPLPQFWASPYGDAPAALGSLNYVGIDSIFTGTGAKYVALRDSFLNYDVVMFKHCNDITFPAGYLNTHLSTATGWKATYNRIKNSAFVAAHPEIKFVFLGTTPGPFNRTVATVSTYTQAAADSVRAFNTWMTDTWNATAPVSNIITLPLYNLWSEPEVSTYRNFTLETYKWDIAPACGAYNAVPLVSCNDHINTTGASAAATLIANYLNGLITP